jgi:hypothetical protein
MLWLWLWLWMWLWMFLSVDPTPVIAVTFSRAFEPVFACRFFGV